MITLNFYFIVYLNCTYVGTRFFITAINSYLVNNTEIHLNVFTCFCHYWCHKIVCLLQRIASHYTICKVNQNGLPARIRFQGHIINTPTLECFTNFPRMKFKTGPLNDFFYFTLFTVFFTVNNESGKNYASCNCWALQDYKTFGKAMR